MPLKSHISPDIFLHIPDSLSAGAREDVVHTGDGEPRGPKTRALNLVFFITGNPGLIAYYHPFLAGVVRRLEEGDRDDRNGVRGTRDRMPPLVVAAAAAGFSLGGFEVEEWERAAEPVDVDAHANGLKRKAECEDDEQGQNLYDLLYPASYYDALSTPGPVPASKGPPRDKNRIYTLTEQIELCYARLENLVQVLRRDCDSRHSRTSRRKNAEQESRSRDEEGSDADADADAAVDLSPSVSVTLIGHSVGAYIALELVRISHERHKTGQAETTPSPSPLPLPLSVPSSHTRKHKPQPYAITSAILLTPTIQDLHVSSSGRIATPLLTYVPFLPSLAQLLVQQALVRLLPRSWLEGLVQRATGMRAGSHGLDTTVAFLASHSGVRQALEMAKCELLEIRGESWGREVWGVSHDDEVRVGSAMMEGEGSVVTRNPGLYFWFAKQDHWVADVTREQILEGRGKLGLVEQEDQVGQEAGGIVNEGVNASGSTRARTHRFRIDETDGLVHAWCLLQSEMVAKRVSGWMRDIIEKQSLS